MKIGLSTFLLDGGKTGVSTYLRELLRFLQLEDVENHYELLMSRDDADLVALSNPNFSKTLTAPVLHQPLLNLAWHNTTLAKKSKAYDVLHIPSARRIPLIKGTRVVATVHDLAAFSVEAKYDSARMFFNRRVIPSMICRADHVIAVSESTKSDIMKYTKVPEDRISVIYSGINHDIFTPVDPVQAREKLHMKHGIDRPFFVYVSRLEHPGKNHVRLIDAFERFKLECDSAHQLILAGADWSGAEAIRARAAESPVKEDILFPGFVPLKSLPLLYSGCDLMIFPSLFEGFGFPIVEALACGAQVTCSNTSSMKEISGDLIPTFDPSDSEAICHAMKQAITGKRSPEIRDRGLKYASTFDWRVTAQKTMEIYQQLG